MKFWIYELTYLMGIICLTFVFYEAEESSIMSAWLLHYILTVAGRQK